MLLPYKANVYVDERPLANMGIVGLLSLVHVCGWLVGPKAMDFMVLSRDNLLPGLLFSWLLHGDIFHLIGNCIFLWTFGNAINCRLGHARYVAVFLLLELISSGGQVLFDGRPTIGASGAISGIVGMFLFLFPRSETKCVWFLMAWGGRIEIPSMYLIVGWFVFDLVGYLIGWGNVAYLAHLGGTVSGFLTALALARLRWITFWMNDKPLIDV